MDEYLTTSNLGRLNGLYKYLKTKKVSIEQVHSEVDGIADEVLAEAQKIIAEMDVKDEDEVKELEQLGFTSIGKVVESKEKSRKKSEAQVLAKKVIYYKQKYPENVFITQDKLEYICEKYGLVIGKPNEFIGNVPQKNRKDMLSFKVNEKDLENVSVNWYEMELMDDNDEILKDKTLRVVATPDQFNTQGKEIDSQYRIVEKDPIILHPVKEGYLIVTKWGKEAEIEV